MTTAPNDAFRLQRINYVRKFFNSANALTNTVPTNSYAGGYLDGTKVGQINRDWKSLVSEGLDASSPYLRREWSYLFPCRVDFTVLDPPNPVTGAWSRATGSSSWSYMTSAMVADRTDVVLQDVALSRIRRRLAAESGKFNSMAPLAEIGDLHRSIKGSIEATSHLLETLIDIKRTKGVSALRHASKAWLTWNFGVSPMISDTKSLLNAILEYKARMDRSIRLSGSANKMWVYHPVPDVHDVTLGLSYPTAVRKTLSYKYIGAFQLLLESANDYTFCDQIGLTPGGLLPAAWELMPYSWALDYFVNIGNFLDDVFLVPPGNLKYLVLDRRYTAEFFIGASLKPTSAQRVEALRVREGSGYFFEFQRSPLATLPHIGLRYRTVDEIGNYGLSKLMNLFSILGKSAPYPVLNTPVRVSAKTRWAVHNAKF